MRISWSRISEWVVLATLVFSILWRGGKGLETTWLAAITICSLVIVDGLRRLLRMEKSDEARTDAPLSLSLLLLTFTGWVIVSYIFSKTKNYGFDEVLRTVTLALTILWTARLAPLRREHLLDSIIQLILWVTVIASFIGIAVYVLQPVNRFVGSFFDFRFTTDYWPNAWAEFLLGAWPLIVIALLKQKNTYRKYLVTAALALAAGTLLLSYSRGGILALGVQLLYVSGLFAVTLLRDAKLRRTLRGVPKQFVSRILLIAVASVVLFLGINLFRSHFHEVQSVTQKITFTASEGTSSIDERSEFWRQALLLSKDHPFIGYGPYSFRFVQPHLADSVLVTSDHPHNVFLKLAVESGWPAAILFCVILLSIFCSSLRTMFSTKQNVSYAATPLLLQTAAIGVIAHNLIDYNLQFIGIALPLWLAIAFLAVPLSLDASSSFAQWKSSRLLLKVQMLAAFTALTLCLIEIYPMFLASLGRHDEVRGKTDASLTLYKEAEGQFLSRDLYLSEANVLMQKGKDAEALKTLDRYIALNAVDGRAWKLRAIAGFATGNLPLAEESIDRAYAYGKYVDLQNLELLLRTASDPKRRTMLLGRKLEFDAAFSDYADAIESDIHFIDLSPAPNQLVTIAKSLSALFPSDAKRYTELAQKAYNHAQEQKKTYSARYLGVLW